MYVPPFRNALTIWLISNRLKLLNKPSKNRSSSSDSAAGVWVWAYHNAFTMCGIVLGFEP